MSCRLSLTIADPATYGARPKAGDLTPVRQEYLSKTSRISPPQVERAAKRKAYSRVATDANHFKCANCQCNKFELFVCICCHLKWYRPFQKHTSRSG